MNILSQVEFQNKTFFLIIFSLLLNYFLFFIFFFFFIDRKIILFYFFQKFESRKKREEIFFLYRITHMCCSLYILYSYTRGYFFSFFKILKIFFSFFCCRNVMMNKIWILSLFLTIDLVAALSKFQSYCSFNTRFFLYVRLYKLP